MANSGPASAITYETSDSSFRCTTSVSDNFSKCVPLCRPGGSPLVRTVTKIRPLTFSITLRIISASSFV